MERISETTTMQESFSRYLARDKRRILSPWCAGAGDAQFNLPARIVLRVVQSRFQLRHAIRVRLFVAMLGSHRLDPDTPIALPVANMSPWAKVNSARLQTFLLCRSSMASVRSISQKRGSGAIANALPKSCIRIGLILDPHLFQGIPDFTLDAVAGRGLRVFQLWDAFADSMSNKAMGGLRL